MIRPDPPGTRACIHQALVALADQHARPPTMREIGLACGISSTATVSYHLAVLVRLGLARNLGGHRGYLPLQRP